MVNIGIFIYVIVDGVVEVICISKIGLGNFICLLYVYGFSSLYLYLYKFVVKNGDFVKKGDLLVYFGNSGLLLGFYLYYEICFIGRLLDLRFFVDWEINNFEIIFIKVRGIRWEYLVNNVE